MGRLKGTELDTVYRNLTSYLPYDGVFSWTGLEKLHDIRCETRPNTGQAVHNILCQAYSDMITGSTWGFGYGDFRLHLRNDDDRDWVVKDIKDSIEKYRAQNPTLPSGSEYSTQDPTGKYGTAGNEVYTNPTTVETDVEEEETKLFSGNTLYLVLGAVAIVLILLLWDKK